MKKITVFFMALMPLLVTILLFAAGLIVKNSTHVYVTAVELPQPNVQILKQDDTKEKQYQLEANVLPRNATNPKLKWESSNDQIVAVDANGVVTCKNYGEAYVYATSDENPTLSSACKVDVYDTVIHSIDITNKYEASYMGVDDTQKIKITTVPSMTHIVNQTINYNITAGDDVIDVSKDGVILPKKEGSATIQITSDDKESKALTELKVNVGAGVNTMCLDNPNTEIISNKDYNLFDHIITAPERIKRESAVTAEASKIVATDFTYTSSNEELAKVDENGKVEFLLPGLVNFTISYKRNPDLKVSKTIECTCDQLKQVYFSGTKYDVAFDENLNDKINWFVYPYNGDASSTKSASGVEIISSDENVVKVTNNNGTPNLTIVGSGSVTLTARIKTADNKYKTDTCSINVLLPKDFIKENDFVCYSCYYPLINNAKTASNKQYKGEISYSLDSTDNAYIDPTTNILHFKKANTSVNVTAKALIKPATDSEAAKYSTKTFKVTCGDILEKIEVQDTVVLKAGKHYEFNNATPIWLDQPYSQYFDYDELGQSAYFIPKFGHKISNFKVQMSTSIREINVIIAEDPIYFSTNATDVHGKFYTTSNSEVDVKNDITPSIFPSTALRTNGKDYKDLVNITYYDPFGPGTAKIEDDIVSFNQAGTIITDVACEVDKQLTINQQYFINSTKGDLLNKFTITDSTETKVYNSYDTIKLDPTGTSTIDLYCKDMDYRTYEDVTIESTTKSDLLTLSNPKFGDYKFTIAANAGKFGKDVIAIKSSVYVLYLNVIVEPTVSDVILYKGSDVMTTQQSTKTYVPDVTLKIQTKPAAKEVDPTDISVSFTGQDTQTLTVGKDYSITLPKEEHWKVNAENTLTIKVGNVERTFKFVYSKDAPTFILEGAVDNKYLYLGSNTTQKECRVVTDGIVSDDWYQNNLEVKFATTELGEKAQFTRQYLSIYGIKLPEAENYQPYKNTLTISLKSDPTKKVDYEMGRDYVSKITFPGHDNDDMTDKKGLQKVHVYGNHSFYEEDKKEVDYYKLPVLLEDHNHKQIVNTEENPNAVETALKTLVPSFGTSSAKYEFSNDGYIKIFFDQNDLYTLEQIRDNEFDSKDGKNVTFTLSTKSNEAKAKYTFVAVHGINQYCQEGLKLVSTQQASVMVNVLQTNFGMTDGTKLNAKLDDMELKWLRAVCGNGYTINFDAISNGYIAKPDSYNIEISWLLNATIRGQDKATMQKPNAENSVYPFSGTYNETFYRYSIVAGFTDPMAVSAVDNKNVTFKECLFRENINGVFYQQDAKNTFTLENCILFDTAGIPLAGFQSNTYIKGFLDIYNFHGKEMLRKIPKVGDMSWAWPVIEKIGREKDMLNRGAAGETFINTFAAQALCGMYFYNQATGQYELSEHGLPGTAEYLTKFANIGIPASSMNAAFWATPNSETHPGSPSYYDEFDKDGNVRLDFLYNQMIKITREIHYF